MNELTSIGLILLLVLMAGHLVKLLKIPEVTGYILVGVALGPSVLGWLSGDNLVALGTLSEVALGLILFSVGSVFEFSLFRRIGRQVLIVTLAESALAAVLVTSGAVVRAAVVGRGAAGGHRHGHRTGFDADGDARMRQRRATVRQPAR